MKSATVVAGLAVLLAGCSRLARQRIELPVAGKLQIRGVTIVDTHNGKLTPAVDILMDEGRIVAITPTSAVAKNSSVRSIAATGKFAVPGYNDMHVHVLDQENSSALFALMLAEGITGFRQMSGSPELLEKRRNGTLPIGKSAPALLVVPGSVLTPFNSRSPEMVRAEIRQQKIQGADFIKVALVSPEVFFAAIAEAKSVGLPILGHLQEGVDAGRASQLGFRSIEHLGPGDPIWIGCSSEESALLADAARHPPLKAPPIPIPEFIQKIVMARLQKRLINPAAFEDPGDVARLQHAFDTYDEAKCRTLATRFVANGAWQVPTLVRLRTQELADSPEYLVDPGLRYITPRAAKEWQEVTDKFHNLPATMRTTFREAYQRQLALTKLLGEAGVPMLAGTDSGGQVPGQSLHQEFDELAKAGLSPLKILQMTTLNPAAFLGRTSTMGSIDVGKNADLVLLDANPIDGVQNMHRIDGVVRAGYYYSHKDLGAVAARVEKQQSRIGTSFRPGRNHWRDFTNPQSYSALMHSTGSTADTLLAGR
jgi:imidazolonepropionase-like amidohydrolase